MPYSELTQRVIAQEPATRDEIIDLLSPPTAQTFAIVNAASSLRYRFFQSTVSALPLPGTREYHAEGRVLEIAPDLETEDIAADIAAIAGATGTVTVDFPELEGHRPLPAMTALRVIAAARIAAPRATIILGDGRVHTLNSLQPLALHVANGLTLAGRDEAEGRPLLADLQTLANGNFKILGADHQDLVAEHETYMREQGYEVPAFEETAGGCGGSCGCGAGGCGA